MGYFSELRNQFKTFADISATQAALVEELNDLKAKPTLTTAEKERYDEIVALLADSIVAANDINNIQHAIKNIETFLDNQPLYFRGEYDPTYTYGNCDVVYFEGSAYVCIANNTRGIVPTETASGKWKIFVKQGVAAQLVPLRGTLTFNDARTRLEIPIGTFDRTKDCLFVYKNGIFLNEDTDYRFSTIANEIVALNPSTWKGASDYTMTFDFVVFKNKFSLGFDVGDTVIFDGGNSSGF